jgi:hypothetical protein
MPEAADQDLRRWATEYRAERVRSVSVGDVVTVDGHAYACGSFGWTPVGPGAGLTFAGGRTAREVVEQSKAANRGRDHDVSLLATLLT